MVRALTLSLLLVAALPASWLPIGPDGGHVQALGRSDADPDRLWAVSYNYPSPPVCFRSTDRGESWSPAGEFELPDVAGLRVDPHQAGLLYACSRGVELWRSTDAGETWNIVITPGRVRALAPDPFTPGRVYGAGFTAQGAVWPQAFVSTDFGLTWSATALDTSYGIMLCCEADPSVPGVAWCGGDSGRVFRTTDGGASWCPRSAGVARVPVLSVAVCPGDPDIVLCGTALELYRTTDGGAGWRAGAGPEEAFGLGFLPGEPRMALAAARDPEPRAWLSSDYGANWSAQTPDTCLFRARVLVVDTAGVAFVDGLAGVARTTDYGATWRYSNRGIRFAHAYTITVNPRDGDEMFTGVHGCRVFRTTDAGASWNRCNGFWCIENGMCCALAVAPGPDSTLLYAFEGYG
ncbi:hypothetical protein JXB37_01405 [candidate division WOR-3 bacterium]|nr:hypothetical protein [candidate division WOR-3 bacterium]